ncbi:GNAT family N-acetyltransferase [Streptomyces sp. NBC_00091]|uniref:GNAT family N-acetyltransferase n=1 Tax=Streptomyces sp. NBC_00091 TaxID=2975648 RepID=UPI002250C68C|nr:GNAT family N-acetyltransferase [Streptomyces sp. NBC_00091]MCX5376980.1 GNAT family N-acetyltransferase [Streptomyces sp. NBC_00091]
MNQRSLAYEELVVGGVRHCRMRREGDPEPVCALEVVSFRQRFGAVAVAAEGIGGVETRPDCRREGYMRELLGAAVGGMRGRVAVGFVSEAIEGAYEQRGFVTALGDGELVVPVRAVERAAGSEGGSAGGSSGGEYRVREGSAADLPEVVRIFNSAHAERPWSRVRDADWDRRVPQGMWKPGSELLVLEGAGGAGGTDRGVAGYALLRGRSFGDSVRTLVVHEMGAWEAAGVRRLLVELAARCWELRLSSFTVREPADSLVGRVARGWGCAYRQRFPVGGGMMARILRREALVRELEPELRRRAQGYPYEGAAVGELARGVLVPDDGMLVRLLLGHWSVGDAVVQGLVVPEGYEGLYGRWFPGGGTPGLPLPHAHVLDRY